MDRQAMNKNEHNIIFYVLFEEYKISRGALLHSHMLFSHLRLVKV